MSSGSDEDEPDSRVADEDDDENGEEAVKKKRLKTKTDKGSSDGSDYEASSKSNNSDDEDDEDDDENEEEEEDKSESEDDDESSDEPKNSVAATKSRAGAKKLDDKTLKLLERENLLRRSSRRREDKEMAISGASDDEFGDAGEGTSEQSSSSSESSSSYDDRPAKKRVAKKRTAPNKQNFAKKQQPRPKRSRRCAGNSAAVDYREGSSSDGANEDDEGAASEDEESRDVPKPAAASISKPVPEEGHPETVEKVIKTRMGSVEATGSATTCYNVDEKGDPNQSTSASPLEQQFLVKWVGWSHLHNTWESLRSLRAMNAGGLKKVDNYVKRLREMDVWRRTADREYVEFIECEQQAAEQLAEQYTLVERIVAHQVSRETAGTEYLCKWTALTYADCTWEDGGLLSQRAQQQIKNYEARTKNSRPPHKSSQVRRRPKFEKLATMPSWLMRRKRRSDEDENGDDEDGDDQMDGREHRQLRDYQLEGLNWLLHAWCRSNSCILADEMGLGKTIQSISFLAALFHRYDLYGPFLVVVPLSTLAAWQHEFERWAPALNLVVYVGDTASREIIRQYEWWLPGTKRLKVNAVLTTYEILLKDKPFLGAVEWSVLAVDEAHRLKNDDSLLYRSLAGFKTDHRLLITGTPLQNSLKELWALLHFIMPETFNSWPDFESEHSESGDHTNFAQLHRRLEPYLLRRVKKDVEKSLPAKVEQILRVDMTAQQKQFYKWILTKNYKELSKGVKGSIAGFVNLMMELKKCCNHASLVRQYDQLENTAAKRLEQLLKGSGKLILLDKLLVRLKERGHRVLIFSQMVMQLDILQEYLQLRRFPCQRLDGGMRADVRKAALDHFNAPDSPDFCFLLSTRAGGLGINLATADTVVIFDSDWNPQNDLQAMSRAHRIGQTKQVNIYRLVTRSSVEEEIVERAKRKLVLDHLVIQRMDTSGGRALRGTSNAAASATMPFSKHDLNDILKFGAEDLFKEKEGEEQEPDVDIDHILSGAETRECDENQTGGSELLNAFKYANFAIDEERDVEAAAEQKKRDEAELLKTREMSQEDGTNNKEWNQIIPREQIERLEEEERQKLEQQLYMAPRQRNKKSDDQNNGAQASDDEEEGRRRKKSSGAKLSQAEAKRFVRAFKKFARPLDRMEAIALDAELEEHSVSELLKLGQQLLADAEKAEKACDNGEAPTQKEEDKDADEEDDDDEGGKAPKKNNSELEKEKRDKGPTCRFLGIDVPIRPMRRLHMALDVLHEVQLSVAVDKGEPWKLPGRPRAPHGWHVEWTGADDAALLRGVFIHGYGSWEAVKTDPALGLAEKIFFKERVKKPLPRHVQARVDFLLKWLKKGSGATRKERSSTANSALSNGQSAKNAAPKVEKKKDKEKKKHKDDKGREKRREERRKEKEKRRLQLPEVGKPSTSTADELDRLGDVDGRQSEAMEDTKGQAFQECVRIMRPVHKYIKRLFDQSNTPSSRQRALGRVGAHIRTELGAMRKAQRKSGADAATALKHVKKWHSRLWILLSRMAGVPAQQLLDEYRANMSSAAATAADVPDVPTSLPSLPPPPPPAAERPPRHHQPSSHRHFPKEEDDRRRPPLHNQLSHHHHHHHHQQQPTFAVKDLDDRQARPLLPLPSSQPRPSMNASNRTSTPLSARDPRRRPPPSSTSSTTSQPPPPPPPPPPRHPPPPPPPSSSSSSSALRQ